MKSIYILNGARTPFSGFGGALKHVTATELGTIASKGALERSGVKPEEIEHVFVGNVIATTKNSPYLARHVALHAGVPIESPALTVNRLCGSGIQAVVSAAQTILLGEANVVLAAGTENMSQSPYVLRNARFGTGLKAPEIDDMLWGTLTDEYIGCGMGITAENLAERYEISRQEQDEFAVRSQQLALQAQRSGRFQQEIVPVETTDKKGKPVTVADDEHIRADATIENLTRLKPAFKQSGTVTAGNSSGINDGAAAVVIANEDFVNSHASAPLAKILSWGIIGVDPNIMGIGPVPACRLALQRAGLSMNDMDLVEINEAFASQYLAVEKELGLQREKVNVNGGAIALGHPVGASGARILYSLAVELKSRKQKYGLASLCIGGGQGIAMVIEAV